MADTEESTGLKTRITSGAVIGLAGLFLIYLGGWFLILLLAAAYVVAVTEWDNIARAGPFPNAIMIFGLVYLSVCFAAFFYLRYFHDNGTWLALMVIIAIAAADSLAYFTGKNLNGPKLAPAISPKKTWAGLGGSVLGAGIIFLLMGSILPSYSSTIASVFHVMPYAPVFSFFTGCFLGAVGQGGDLLISFFKRRAGLKDAGDIIPGHGGILDRIDSHLLAVAVFALISFAG